MLTICTATLKDYLAVNNLVKEGHEEHVREMPAVFKSGPSVMPEAYYRELLESSNSRIFIAKNQEEVIGFAVVSIESSPPFDSLVQRRYAYIHDFSVKMNTQKQGVGKLLFTACVDWAQAMNVTSLELNVWEFNTNAIDFYKHLGMESISQKMSITI
ncbi:GNAT family N-acetyltransferase [Metasolibacillus meyeri]|uniref:GNAT family N-acetyltransferase n=1 Tax=Metasolibacillus meyeri TaxID=1071052 RepID=A0AAW9NQA7_9BACL|nr:GNAT family N-acetyltransferase [Metasolibacillus meyeri]MEC1178048.1 GNAT family N-acetyltransferase [Metasolibacillus meyeri]